MGTPNDPRGRGITVTIKYGKAYDDTWAVFHGTTDDVRADITRFFGIPSTSETALTLSELVINATGIAHGIGALASELGAVVLASDRDGATAQEATRQPDPWTQASATPNTPPAIHAVLFMVPPPLLVKDQPVPSPQPGHTP